MSFERRLNGLEHKLSPQGSGDSCWKCGGLPARSARLLVVKNRDEVDECQQCGLKVGPDGRPFAKRLVFSSVSMAAPQTVMPDALMSA